MKVNALEYTVTDEPDGKLKALRYGEEWRCCIGDNLILSLAMQLEDARNYIAKLSEVVCQVLGKALGYPAYKEDPVNFSNATDADGVCYGDHVPESILQAAANYIAQLEERCETFRRNVEHAP